LENKARNIIDSTNQTVESSLPLMEDFYTIQGEGYHAGKAAYFIRLAGCDVGCVWCDVKESWDANSFPVVSVDDMVNRVSQSPARIVVITGGEPALYNLTELTLKLRNKGFQIHIETSGTRELKGVFDWITVSPKKFKDPLDEVLCLANELKAVVYHETDMAWVLKYTPKLKNNCKLYLQPEFSRKEKMIPAISAFIMKNPEWNLSLQIHKIIGLP
jgi:7-carboxy-7-deazaguanine synthase